LSIFLLQALRAPEDAAEITDILAEHDDILITSHRHVDGAADRLDHRHAGHRLASLDMTAIIPPLACRPSPPQGGRRRTAASRLPPTPRVAGRAPPPCGEGLGRGVSKAMNLISHPRLLALPLQVRRHFGI